MKIRSVLCLMAAMVMLACFTAAAPAEEVHSMDLKVLPDMEMSVSEWMESDTSRTYFAAIMLLEMAIDTVKPDSDNISSTAGYALARSQAYIASSKKNGIVSVLFFGDSFTVVAAYSPMRGEASWSYLNITDSPSATMSLFKSTGDMDEYHVLDSMSVIEALQEIMEIISD